MTITEFQTLRLETDDLGVATLTLYRPDKHNALNEQLIAELTEAAGQLAADRSVRVVVLTGAGASFCAGGDLNWFAGNINRTPEQRREQSDRLADMLYALDTLPKPLIGRINGSAYGGGVGMISVCDLAVAVDNARFGLTEVRLGLLPATISPYVVARIGAVNARATMLSGALFGADQAQTIGLLNDCCPVEQLDSRIGQIVADHLQAAPGAVAATKQLIRTVSGQPVENCRAVTAERLSAAWDSEEGRTGIDCFLNKRRAPWRSD